MNGRLPVVAALVTLTAVWSVPAEACSPLPPCTPAQFAPADEVLLPANVGLFFVPPHGDFADGGTPETASLVVTALDDGGVVPFTSLLLPSGAYDVRPMLAPGTRYQVQYVDGCAEYGFGTGPTEFTTTWPRDLPDRVGEVVVHAEWVRNISGSLGFCGGPRLPSSAAVVVLRVDPDPKLEPFLPVTRLVARIDGEVVAMSDFPLREDRTFELTAHCGGRDTISPGWHDVVITAEVAGAGVFEAAPVSAHFDCDSGGCSAAPGTLMPVGAALLLLAGRRAKLRKRQLE